MIGRALVAAVLLAGCATRQRVVTPVRVPTAPAPRAAGALEAGVATQCGACHDGEPGRPTFDGKQAFSRRDAMSVALAIASNTMPPAPKQLEPAERRRLLQLACERTAEGEPVSACLERLVPTEPSMWLVYPSSLRLLVDLAVGPGLKPPADPDSAPMALVKPEVRTVRLGLSLMTLLTLYAAERCHDSKEGPEATRYERCLERALDYRQGALPRLVKRTP